MRILGPVLMMAPTRTRLRPHSEWLVEPRMVGAIGVSVVSMKSVIQLAATTLIVAWVFRAPAAIAQDKLYIDASKTGAPISKYVYGQFVEHLGRSVYGGLWAEMLEDRKFARPITDDYSPFDLASDSCGKPAAFTYLKNSPWKVIGPKGTVTMDKTAAYVGDASPMIHLPGDG